MPFEGLVVPFRAMVEYRPISAEDLSRLHQFGSKVFPGKFLGYAPHAGGTGKETSRWTHLKSMQEKPDAKAMLTPMSGENFIFPIADGTVKLSGRDQILRTSTLNRDRPDR